MDAELLVDTRVEDGRRLLAELAAQGFDVAIAFWVRTEGEGLWFLYIASSRIGRVSIADAYRSVYASLRQMKDPSFTVSQIKLVSPDNPIAVGAMAIRQKFSTTIPIRYNGNRLGQLAIEEAYIYPPVAAGMDRAQVLHTVTQLMNSGVNQPSLVTLRNGSSFQAIPLGIQVGQPGEIAVVVRNVTSGVDESLSVDEIMNIQ